MGDRREFAFLDWPCPIPFSHRGDSTSAPENTMAAFDAAVNLGYRYIETDVHATSDSHLIAFHNRRPDEVTDRTGVVERLSWNEIRRARVNDQEPIPKGTWMARRHIAQPEVATSMFRWSRIAQRVGWAGGPSWFAGERRARPPRVCAS